MCKMGTLSYLFVIFISILSSIIFISAILYSDRKSKEPGYMIALALLSGVFTIAVSLLVGKVILPHLNYLNYESYTFVKVLIFAFVEESAKLTVLYFFIQKNSNFDDVYDGFVYSSLIALSFAAFETVMYVFTETDFSSMIHLGIIRGITSIPLHLICGIVMGYYVGTEKFTKKNSMKMFKLFNSLTVFALAIDSFISLHNSSTFSFIVSLLKLKNILYLRTNYRGTTLVYRMSIHLIS